MRAVDSSKLKVLPALVSLLCGGAAACQAGSVGNAGVGGSGGGATASSTAETSTDASTASTGSGFMSGTGTGGTGPTCTPGGPDDDVDMDGFTQNQGDCDDCDPNRNPNAIEVATPMGKEPFDEDCDMQIDEDDSVLCDDMLALDSNDPLDAARAIELCKLSTGPQDWGIVGAKWTLADGSPLPNDPAWLSKYHLGHGIFPAFGANVVNRKGANMLALSSGTARGPNDPGYQDPGSSDKGITSPHPDGFPKESEACPGTLTGEPHDVAAVELEILTPSNAKGISFDFDFFTYEWPGFVCSTFNDFFVAILEPFPPGQSDGNISFDSQGNPVSVNNGFVDACGCDSGPPCQADVKTFPCSLGTGILQGTGFGKDTTQWDDHAATGWLETKSPVTPGSEVTLRFAIWDAGDHSLDSTVLVDNFVFSADEATGTSTKPVPTPK